MLVSPRAGEAGRPSGSNALASRLGRVAASAASWSAIPSSGKVVRMAGTWTLNELGGLTEEPDDPDAPLRADGYAELRLPTDHPPTIRVAGATTTQILFERTYAVVRLLMSDGAHLSLRHVQNVGELVLVSTGSVRPKFTLDLDGDAQRIELRNVEVTLLQKPYKIEKLIVQDSAVRGEQAQINIKTSLEFHSERGDVRVKTNYFHVENLDAITCIIGTGVNLEWITQQRSTLRRVELRSPSRTSLTAGGGGLNTETLSGEGLECLVNLARGEFNLGVLLSVAVQASSSAMIRIDDAYRCDFTGPTKVTVRRPHASISDCSGDIEVEAPWDGASIEALKNEDLCLRGWKGGKHAIVRDVQLGRASESLPVLEALEDVAVFEPDLRWLRSLSRSPNLDLNKARDRRWIYLLAELCSTKSRSGRVRAETQWLHHEARLNALNGVRGAALERWILRVARCFGYACRPRGPLLVWLGVMTALFIWAGIDAGYHLDASWDALANAGALALDVLLLPAGLVQSSPAAEQGHAMKLTGSGLRLARILASVSFAVFVVTCFRIGSVKLRE